MIDSSIKNHGEVEYDKHKWLKHQKTPVCPKSRSEVYLILALYINRSVTKTFPIKTLLETIDSNVRCHGEVEYDKQNCLRHQKIQVLPKNSKWDLLLLSLYINRSITKKFPIKTLLETIDSSVKSLGEVEYDNQNSLQHQKPPVSAISCEPCESTENSWEAPWSLVLGARTQNHCALEPEPVQPHFELFG